MKGGWGGARWLLVRSQRRHTTAALLVLTLVVAATGGVVLGALAGARRSESAFSRFREAVGSNDIAVQASGGESLDLGVMDEIRATPGVADAAAFAFVAASPTSFPSYFSLAVAQAGDQTDFLVLEGRRPDPDEATEVIVNEAMRDALGADIGDHVPFASLAPDQLDAWIAGADVAPGGPSIDMTIVGIGRSPEDVSDAPDPIAVLTPAFLDQYGSRLLTCTCVIQVRSEEGSQSAVVDTLADLLPTTDVAVEEDYGGRVRDAVAIQADAFRLIALAVALAGWVILVSVGRRLQRETKPTADRLHALGWSRRAIWQGMLLTWSPAVVLGALGAGALGYLLSPLGPVGLARRAEIDPGLRMDLLVTLLGVPGVALAGLVAVAVPTRFARRREAPLAATAVRSRSLLAVSLGRRAVRGPGRGGVLGTTLAVGAGVAALTLSAAIDRTLDTPAWFGSPAEIVSGSDDPAVVEAITAAAALDPSVDAVAEVWVPTLDSLDEDIALRSSEAVVRVAPTALVSKRGLMQPTMRSGRPPAGGDEIVLGGSVLAALRVDVGDDVVVETPDGDLSLTVVGEVITAGTDVTDGGAVLTGDGLARLGSTFPREALIRPAAGVTADQLVATFAARGLPLDVVEIPSEVRNLGELGPVPGWAAGSIATVGFGAVVVALLVARRAGARDQSILRALGLSRRTARWAVLWQGILAGVAGTVLGVPLGWLAGRTLHRYLADRVSVLAPAVWPPVWWLVVAAALAASFLAAVPFALARSAGPPRTE